MEMFMLGTRARKWGRKTLHICRSCQGSEQGNGAKREHALHVLNTANKKLKDMVRERGRQIRKLKGEGEIEMKKIEGVRNKLKEKFFFLSFHFKNR